jgi:hypothetical protein
MEGNAKGDGKNGRRIEERSREKREETMTANRWGEEEEGEGEKEKEAWEEKHGVKMYNTFWEELIAYFPLIQHGLHRERRAQQSSSTQSVLSFST